MVSKIRVNAVWNVAKTEFVKWITNPRMIILAVFIFFIHSFVVQPMNEHVLKYGEPLNVFEPFIAISNSGFLMLLMPIVFILLISDFPKMGESSLYYIQRTGKLNWFLGQMLHIIISIFTFIFLILVSCMIMSKGTFSGKWSNTISKYDARFPDEAEGFVSKLIASNIYNQISLKRALFYAIALLGLQLFMIALILCIMKMMYLHSAGLFTAVSIVAIGTAAAMLNVKAMWFFPTANSMLLLHYHAIMRKEIMPMSNSFMYYIFVDMVLIIANLFVIFDMQFINIDQEEI